jgi:hypothetical protein
MPTFPNPDIQHIQYNETSRAERYNLIQTAETKSFLRATKLGGKTKVTFDRKTKCHSFKIGDLALVATGFVVTNNPKLVPKWKGPTEIIDVNDTNANIKINSYVH